MSPVISLVRHFIEALSSEKGYSANTCRAYAHDLEEFVSLSAAFLEKDLQDVPLELLDALAIRRHIGYLYKTNTKTSIGRKLSAIRSFFTVSRPAGHTGCKPGRDDSKSPNRKPHPGISSHR